MRILQQSYLSILRRVLHDVWEFFFLRKDFNVIVPLLFYHLLVETLLAILFMTSQTSCLEWSFCWGLSWGPPPCLGLSLLFCGFAGCRSSSKQCDPSRTCCMYGSLCSSEGYPSLYGHRYKLLLVWTNLHKWLAWTSSSILSFRAWKSLVVCPQLWWYQQSLDMLAFHVTFSMSGSSRHAKLHPWFYPYEFIRPARYMWTTSVLLLSLVSFAFSPSILVKVMKLFNLHELGC